MVQKNKIEFPILTIIIPTFNEVNNIPKIVEKLESALSKVKYQIIFVDDESNDGTINKIRSLEAQKSNISLLLRIGRRGLSGACIEGMLISNTILIAVMDCDLQHDEKKLLEMVNKFQDKHNLDLIIGSRHTKNGRSEDGFNKFRKLGSDFAILLTKKLEKILNNKLKNKVVTFLGVTFKPNTDDMREASSIPMIKYLNKKNAKIRYYDPTGEKNEFKRFKNVKYCKNISSACLKSDLIVLHTEWNDFRLLNFKKLIKKDDFKIFDMRNIYSPIKMKNQKIDYFSIGR